MTGASNDFEKATSIARNMVCRYGMYPDLGVVVYDFHNPAAYSQKTAFIIDMAIKSILDQALATATKILQDNRDKLDKLALALLKEETLSAAQIYELLDIAPRGNHNF